MSGLRAPALLSVTLANLGYYYREEAGAASQLAPGRPGKALGNTLSGRSEGLSLP